MLILKHDSDDRPAVVEISHPKTTVHAEDLGNDCIQIQLDDPRGAFFVITTHEIAARLMIALSPVVGERAVWMQRHEYPS